MAEPRIQYVTSADGVRIAFTSIGEGDPIVFVSNVWGEMQLALERAGPIYGTITDALLRNNFRLVIYDGRGCGHSDRNVNEMSHAARLADLDAVIDRLGLERFGLLAIIHGSTAAIAYAAEHPDRVTHLVLEAPYARGADYYARHLRCGQSRRSWRWPRKTGNSSP